MRRIITEDERDITHEEWRVIPEFPKYRITKDGDVQNRSTGNLLKEHINTKTGAYSYNLRKDGDKAPNYSRNYQSLVYAAFPELKPETDSPKFARKKRSSLWRDIPGFPKYQVHPDGRVRFKTNQALIKLRVDSETGEPIIQFIQQVKVSTFLELAFPENQKEAA